MLYMNRPGSNHRLPTKRIQHRNFSKFCSSFQKKVLKEFGDSLQYFAEADLIEEYKPLALKAKKEPVVSRTFCFLEGTNFGWCTLWLEEPDSVVVQCEFHFAEHGSASFSFPRGFEWGKRHDLVFDAQISNKWWAIQQGLDKLHKMNLAAAKGLLGAVQVTKKLIRVVEEQSSQNNGLTGTIVAVIKNWNQLSESKTVVYNPFVPDTGCHSAHVSLTEIFELEEGLRQSLIKHRENRETIAKNAP